MQNISINIIYIYLPLGYQTGDSNDSQRLWENSTMSSIYTEQIRDKIYSSLTVQAQSCPQNLFLFSSNILWLSIFFYDTFVWIETIKDTPG